MLKHSRIIRLAPLALAIAITTPVFAHPGGGGGMGMGGGMGGGMGMGVGRGIGVGSGVEASHGISASGMGSQHAAISTHSSVTALNNGHLDASLSNALTKSGISLTSDLKTTCSGFHSLGQCVAALHVAQNLSLPGGFAALKAAMTGDSRQNLGAAIQQLSPNADAKAAMSTAKRQAAHDLAKAEREVSASD